MHVSDPDANAGGSPSPMGRVAVDCSGGDAPLAERVCGAVEAAVSYRDISVLLCGPRDEVRAALDEQPEVPDTVSVLDAPESIDMHESPVQALRQKPRSSIALAVEMVADGEADAFVSAGNTGAAAAAATLKLGRPAGVYRPGIAAPMQVLDFPVVTIDVGANVNCKPVHLLQYGIMASVFARDVLEIEQPRVGLLNVGEETTKGSKLTREAFDLLSNADLDFVGNIEPEHFFDHQCDVLVCDGFTGNTILKFGESLVLRMIGWLREQVGGNLRYKLGMALCKDLFKHLRHCADYTEYGGAPLLGVNGVIIITHGSSDARAIHNAVREARSFVQHHVNEHIEEAIRRDTARRCATD